MKYRMTFGTAKRVLYWVMTHTNNEAIVCQCEQVYIELKEIGLVEYHRGVIRSIMQQFYRDLPVEIRNEIKIINI
jgi:hypothetical protein